MIEGFTHISLRVRRRYATHIGGLLLRSFKLKPRWRNAEKAWKRQNPKWWVGEEV